VSAQAVSLVNGGFETGDLTGWTVVTGSAGTFAAPPGTGDWRLALTPPGTGSPSRISQSVDNVPTACPYGVRVHGWVIGIGNRFITVYGWYAGSDPVSMVMQLTTGSSSPEYFDVLSDGSSGEMFTVEVEAGNNSQSIGGDDFAIECIEAPATATPTATPTETLTPTATNTLDPFPTIPHDTGQTSGGDEFIVYRTTTYGDLAVFAGVMGVFVTVLLSLMLTILDRARPRQD